MPKVAVIGASGLIGEAVTRYLMSEGIEVVAIARRLSPAQKFALGPAARECPIVDLAPDALAELFDRECVDVVVNCVGVLRPADPGSDDVHEGFVGRLLEALPRCEVESLLVHLSIPGQAGEDATPFSTTKRSAERSIASGGVPHVLLRPGFVIAPAPYGASALMRSLAMLPVCLPGKEAAAPFMTTEVADIGRTIAVAVRKWRNGERGWGETWEVMSREPTSVGDVLTAFRDRYAGPRPVLRLPAVALNFGAVLGDFAARLGWSPPIGRTALQEARRGVRGDPEPWIAATGIEPLSIQDALARNPVTIQEKWFAHLYLIKAVAIFMLTVFWTVSGLIVLGVSFKPAAAILTAHGFPAALANAVTVVSSCADIAVGAAIAFQRTCRAGLLFGIGLSLFYLVSAAVITPDMWVEPLGALVKTGPAIILMMATLAMLEKR